MARSLCSLLMAVELMASVFGFPYLAPPPPPPLPSPPGVGCSGEQIFTSTTGSVSVAFTAGGRDALECSFLIRTSANGLTLSFSQLQLTASSGESCQGTAAQLKVYDGSSTLDPMLATYACDSSWSVGSTGGSMLLVFTEDSQHYGSFSFSWAESANSCNNGVCEGSADEYDTECGRSDCVDNRPGDLPALSVQHHDTKWCESYDQLTATTLGGESTTMEYTVAHFGPGIPVGGLVMDVGVLTEPFDACSAITGISRGANVSALALSTKGRPLAGTAYLSGIYNCHFIDKALHVESAGGGLHLAGNQGDSLFYMAAAESRQTDVLSLDIPSILIRNTGKEWLEARVGTGILLEIGAPEYSRCSGARELTAASGALQSTPPGQKYCSWQTCMWQLRVPTDDIIVLTFTRFQLECATATDGSPYDWVKVHDGATEHAPLLATLTCTHAPAPVVATGNELFVHFYSDDLFNFEGFSAHYASGVVHCSGISTCGDCSASNVCAWCKSSHTCVPELGAQASCSDNAFAANATMCCAAGFSGGQCDECAPGHFGASCTACDCGAGGVCNAGKAGDGTCVCNAGWAGTKCDACAAGSTSNFQRDHCVVCPEGEHSAEAGVCWSV